MARSGVKLGAFSEKDSPKELKTPPPVADTVGRAPTGGREKGQGMTMTLGEALDAVGFDRDAGNGEYVEPMPDLLTVVCRAVEQSAWVRSDFVDWAYPFALHITWHHYGPPVSHPGTYAEVTQAQGTWKI